LGVAFDPEKDASNIAKRGMSLAPAVEMDMAAALVREDDRFDYGEPRYIAFGEIADAPLSHFHVSRQQVRAISLRKANKKEISRHGRQTQI
jgi:uncharacterized DUF497 family protein